MTAQALTVVLTEVECANCHMTFGVPVQWERDRRRQHDRFYCPNGHSLSFPGESDLEREKRLRNLADARRVAAEVRVVAARDQAQAAERSARALRGHITRLRNRIAAGECPAGCHRSFVNVRRHIEGQHPEWAAEHAEVLS